MILLTVQEVANMLKLSVLTIYKYIKEQKLEAVSFGGHYRISESSLDSFIESHVVSRNGLRNDQVVSNSNDLIEVEDIDKPI